MSTSVPGVEMPLLQQARGNAYASITMAPQDEDQFANGQVTSGYKKTLHPRLVNLRHLRSFLAACEFGSIERTSHNMHRSKSAVTRSIQEIECALGVPLFERSGSSIKCNPHGEVVRYRAERALCEFGSGLMALSGKPNALYARVRFPDNLFHISRLQAFVAMTETKDLLAAAMTLAVTPHYISRSINHLERSLDMLLFERASHRKVPTTAAQAFSIYVKRALFELEQIDTELSELRKLAVPS